MSESSNQTMGYTFGIFSLALGVVFTVGVYAFRSHPEFGHVESILPYSIGAIVLGIVLILVQRVLNER